MAQVPLKVPACRDCRHSVPGESDGENADATARCTHPDVGELGTPHYHLAIAEAPLCEAARQDPLCAAEGKLFEAHGAL